MTVPTLREVIIVHAALDMAPLAVINVTTFVSVQL